MCAAIALLGIALSGCAGSATKPIAVSALANPTQKLSVTDVTATATPGIGMGNDDLVRIVDGIKGKLTADRLMAAQSPDALPVTLQINFTSYDPGNAGARALMMGLGQIHIDGEIAMVDASGIAIGKYQIAKQFAGGGLWGAATTIKDVEAGFEASVADMIKDPSGSARTAEKKKPRPL